MTKTLPRETVVILLSGKCSTVPKLTTSFPILYECTYEVIGSRGLLLRERRHPGEPPDILTNVCRLSL